MRVLVTRPSPGAARTAARLVALGHEPLLLPLTTIVPLTPQWPAGRFDAVLATSANAFTTAATLPESWKALPVHVVGERTAEAAMANGFSTIAIKAADTNALLAQLSGTCSRGSRVAYLCGRVRRPDLESGLTARGVFVTEVETYDTNSVSYSTDNLNQRLEGMAPDAVLVMSGEAALALALLLRQPDTKQLFENARIYCLSGRMAEGLEPLAPGRIFVSETPDETAILRALDEVWKV